MSDANVELLKRAWAAFARGDEEKFAACLTPDWCEHGTDNDGVGRLYGEREAMRAHRVAFPDMHAEIHQIVADDTTVACYCTVRATHTGRYFDLEPTGKTIVLREMMFNRVRDGRLSETWAMVDTPGFYEQLTGRPAPQQLDNMT